VKATFQVSGLCDVLILLPSLPIQLFSRCIFSPPFLSFSYLQKEQLKAYIVAEKNLGTKLKHVVRRNLAYQVKVGSLFDTQAIFDTMPEFLFHTLQESNHADTVERHRFFTEWGEDLRGCMSMLMTILKPVAVMKGELVCQAGHRCLTMYWVEKGTCRAEKPTKNIAGGYDAPGDGDSGSIKGEEEAEEEFEAGEHFGEECIFVPSKTRCRMTRTVRTVSNSNLLALRREDFAVRLHRLCPLLWARIRRDLDAGSDERASEVPGGSWVEIVQPASAVASVNF